MPRYTFVTDDGERFEHSCSVADYCEVMQLDDGRRARRDFVADLPTISRPSSSAWPMKPCMSTGVHADQAQDLRDLYRKNGLGIEVTPGGDPIYTSQRQMDSDLKLRGFVDRN